LASVSASEEIEVPISRSLTRRLAAVEAQKDRPRDVELVSYAGAAGSTTAAYPACGELTEDFALFKASGFQLAA
jgi:hypothetical protein